MAVLFARNKTCRSIDDKEQEIIVGTLADDITLYADEVYTKRDLKAGIKLISEIAGVVAIVLRAKINEEEMAEIKGTGEEKKRPVRAS